MVNTKIVSSLEKCFLTDKISDFKQVRNLTMLKNERLSFQVLVEYENDNPANKYGTTHWSHVKLRGRLAKYASVRIVDSVAVKFPMYPYHHDDNYIFKGPGLYPDLLNPLVENKRVPLFHGNLIALWITVDPKGKEVGEFPLTVSITGTNSDKNVYAKSSVKIKVIDAELPKQELKISQWFHCDAIAQHYNCKVFSAQWWKLIKKFVQSATKNGMNMILTPIFTPPLDTEVGRERLTVQLVDVTVNADGSYSFGYENLDKWLDLVSECGIKYYEIAHLFTQWGAAHAPKVVATVDGKKKRIFGWDTVAGGKEYTAFLRHFIPDFIAHMKARGEDHKCHFHISDEPNTQHLEQYTKSHDSIIDLLDGYTVMDALSEYQFYESGLVTTPVPGTNHIQPFLEHNVPNLWTYYCCGQSDENVSNRFIAMPSHRNRCLGAQLYKHYIVGFMHWGFNFYNSCRSWNAIEPMLDTTGDYFVPSGDCFLVYPGKDGPLESLRLCVFYDAIQDFGAFKLCESLIGRQKTLEAIESACGEVAFTKCPTKDEVIAVREVINQLIEQNL